MYNIINKFIYKKVLYRMKEIECFTRVYRSIKFSNNIANKKCDNK